MREIKFRAWSLRLKKFLSEKNVMDVHTMPTIPHGDNFELDQTNVVLMQYIGLKDEKGREIYQNDYLTDDDSEPMLHRIVWDEEGAKFELETWEGKDNFSSGLIDDLASLACNGVLKGFEVTGNSFENPEIIKQVPREY